MPKVKFKARTTAEIEDLDIENGSLIYNTENGKTYLDYDNERISTGGGAGGGVATGDTPPENPEENDLWVDTNDEEHLAEVDDEVSTTSTNAVQNQAITNYVNDLNTYSTTEQVVGTWIDGKPIYRTSINVSNITTYNNYVSTGVTISDIDNVIDIKSAAKRVPDSSQPSNVVWYITGGLTEKTINADYVTAIRIASGDVQYLANASSYRITGMTITIEYTKTTD